jgi:DNA end-binding protein Ku
MSVRANWKGYLKVAELACPVALYAAASTSERIAFHILNRKTGHRVHRQFIDSETGKPVEADDQAKGYETAQNRFVLVDAEEIAAAIPESDKTLTVQAFVTCDKIDDLYLDRPYYLAPGDAAAHQTYSVLRDGMRAKKVAAIATTVLFRRMRTLLLRAGDEGILASTLSFDYEIRSAEDAFDEIPKMKLQPETLKLAEHIIKTKKGKFDAASFDDRYEAALADIVRAKVEGKPIKARPPVDRSKVIDLMEALRQSAAAGSGRSRSAPAGAKPGKKPTASASKSQGKARAPARRKAG